MSNKFLHFPLQLLLHPQLLLRHGSAIRLHRGLLLLQQLLLHRQLRLHPLQRRLLLCGGNSVVLDCHLAPHLSWNKQEQPLRDETLSGRLL